MGSDEEEDVGEGSISGGEEYAELVCAFPDFDFRRPTIHRRLIRKITLHSTHLHQLHMEMVELGHWPI